MVSTTNNKNRGSRDQRGALSLKSARAQVHLSRPRQMAPVPANRPPPRPRPKPERYGRREYPTVAGCGCKECGIRSPLGDRFCVILREARKPDWGPTVHPPAQGRRLTQEAAGRTGSLPGRLGLGVPRQPPTPGNHRPRSWNWGAQRGEGAQPGCCGGD